MPRPGQDYTVGSAPFSLPAAWELPLLSRSNLGIDSSKQNIEKGTQSPATEAIPAQECRGHFCNRMCTVLGLEGGPSWQGRSNLIIK